MSDKVLAKINDPMLKVYAVWEPILRTDNARAAAQSRSLLQDSRVEHYWTPTRDVGTLFQKPIRLRSEPAWDVYLVYPRGVTWGDAPPNPEYFMHQLRGRLPEGNRLDADALATRVRETLAH